MNRCLYLLFVALLLVASLFFMACDEHHSRATALLCRADSLTASCPDSAFQLLESCKSEIASWPESQQMRFHLLHAKAQNKAYVPFTSDTMMNAAVDYYDRNGTANEQMEAHYLLGCVYRDLSDAPKALSAYHDALECADTTADDCNYNILSRVCAQMSDLFYYQNLFENQLASLDRASHYSYLAKDTFAAQLIYSQKMDAYKMLMLPDSMLYVSEKASNYFREAGYNEMAAGISFVPVRYLLDCGEITKAKEYMDLFEHESGLFDENNNIEPGREVYYYTKGYYYLKTSQYDSAEYFFRKELITGKDFNNQNAGSRGLALLFQKIHKPDSAAKYALYSYEMNDSVYAHKVTEEVAKTKTLYDYTRYEHYAQQEKERADRERSKTIFVVFLALIVISVIVTLFWMMRKRHRAAYRRAVRNLGEAQNTILHLREHEAMLKSAIEKYAEEHIESEELIVEMANLKSSIQEYEEEIKRQKSILDRYHQKEILTKENVDQKINQSDIYKHLRIIANQGKHLTDEDWKQLMQLVFGLLPGFYQLLSSKERELSRLDYQICILDRLGIEPRRMQYLLGISESYVSRKRSDLHMKLFGSAASGKEFSLAIRNIC